MGLIPIRAHPDLHLQQRPQLRRFDHKHLGGLFGSHSIHGFRKSQLGRTGVAPRSASLPES
jgi:hypothetical protein